MLDLHPNFLDLFAGNTTRDSSHKDKLRSLLPGHIFERVLPLHLLSNRRRGPGQGTGRGRVVPAFSPRLAFVSFTLSICDHGEKEN